MRVGAHAPVPARGQGLELRHEAPGGVEELLRPVAPHPLFQQLQIHGIVADVGERYLMRTPRPFDLVALDLLGSGPALGRSQDDHRPERTNTVFRCAGGLLMLAYLVDGPLQYLCHSLVHLDRIAAFDEIRRVTIPDEQGLELLMTDPRQNRGVGDLVAVQIQDRQHGAVPSRVDELVGMPGGGQRSGLGFAVADDAGHDQIGIVECHSVGVRQAVAKLSALVDRTRRLRGHVAADVTGKRELLEETPHPFDVLALVRIDLGVRPFQIRRAEHARRPVARSGHENHVEVVLDDQPVEMDPDERERRTRAPVAKEPVLHVLGLERLLQQRVVLQVDHSHGQVVARAPVGVHQRQHRGGVFLVRRRFQLTGRNQFLHGVSPSRSFGAFTAGSRRHATADSASIDVVYLPSAAAAVHRAR